MTDVIFNHGNYGVDWFFLLSGFILIHVYRQTDVLLGPRRFAAYLWRRLARIYPAYLAALIGMVLLVIGADLLGLPRSPEMYPLYSLPSEFLMLQSWFVPLPSWNYPAWSVSAEWFAYLFVFPLTLALFRFTERKKHGLFLAVLIAGIALAVLAISPRVEGLPHPLVRVGCEFLAGGLMYRGFIELAARPQMANIVFFLPLGMLGLIFLDILPLPQSVTSFSIVTCLLALTVSLAVPQSVGAICLGRQPFVYLGQISYSLYLAHTPVQRVLKVALPVESFQHSPAIIRWLVFGAHLAAVLLAAMALYHLVESPCRRWLTAKRKGRSLRRPGGKV